MTRIKEQKEFFTNKPVQKLEQAEGIKNISLDSDERSIYSLINHERLKTMMGTELKSDRRNGIDPRKRWNAKNGG